MNISFDAFFLFSGKTMPCTRTREEANRTRAGKASNAHIHLEGGTAIHPIYYKLAQAILVGILAVAKCKKGGLPQSNPPILMA